MFTCSRRSSACGTLTAAFYCRSLPACQSADHSPAKDLAGAVSPAHLWAEITALLWIDPGCTLVSAVQPAQQSSHTAKVFLRCPLQALYNLPTSQPSLQQSAWWAEAWLGDLQTRLHPSLADLTHFGSQPDGLSPAAAAVACMHPVVEQVMADLAGTPGMEAVLACTEGASFGRIAARVELGVPVSQSEVGSVAKTSWRWSPARPANTGRESVQVSTGKVGWSCNVAE